MLLRTYTAISLVCNYHFMFSYIPHSKNILATNSVKVEHVHNTWLWCFSCQSRKWPEVNLEAIIAYIQREYHLPPLTYSLKLLLEEKVLKSFACWVRHMWPAEWKPGTIHILWKSR